MLARKQTMSVQCSAGGLVHTARRSHGQEIPHRTNLQFDVQMLHGSIAQVLLQEQREACRRE